MLQGPRSARLGDGGRSRSPGSRVGHGGRSWSPGSRLYLPRPWRTPTLIGAYTLAILLVDAATRSTTVQIVVGALTFLVLLAATRRSGAAERRQVWIIVGLATLLEIFASQFWGAYRYRLGVVPLYVPPGHGLIYLAALRVSHTRVLRHRAAIGTAVIAALAWAVAGLTLIPLRGGRVDVLGALLFVPFAFFALCTSRGRFFAAAFAVTSLLEITGTLCGDWQWVPITPAVPLPSGNPPSVIAGAYCMLDLAALLTHRQLSHLLLRRRAGLATTRRPDEVGPQSVSA